ncbi:hypothetical protein HN011_010166 [Eciton burchellii]|nr:hypothetical protein HN011_010166 [Eciton burchellii]
MNTPSDIFQSGQYKLNRVLLSLLGQWPFQKARHRQAVLFTLLFIIVTEVIAQVLALVTLWDDLDVMFECAPSLLIHCICFSQLLNLVYNMKKIKTLLVHVQRDWRSCSVKSEFEILRKFAENGRSITIRYITGVYTFGSLFLFLTMIPKFLDNVAMSNYSTKPIGFVHHVEYYIDLEKYYYPVLIHGYLAGAIRITIVVAYDTCIAMLVQHCCALFSVVRYRLKHIQRSMEQDKEFASLGKDEKIYMNFVHCIRRHEAALRFACCLEIIYMKALFAEIGFIVLCISLSTLQAVKSFTLNHIIRYAGFIFAQLLHLFLVCWLGQQIIDHSDRVFTSTYNSEWYELSCKFRKLLNMIMLRSISPCTLTIGKIMVLSLPSFSTVIRMSASYFTVLRSI